MKGRLGALTRHCRRSRTPRAASSSPKPGGHLRCRDAVAETEHNQKTEETMSLTQELGRFVASLTFERLPAEAAEIARTGITDTVATMIAGAHDPAPQLLRRGL